MIRRHVKLAKSNFDQEGTKRGGRSGGGRAGTISRFVPTVSGVTKSGDFDEINVAGIMNTMEAMKDLVSVRQQEIKHWPVRSPAWCSKRSGFP
jgi:hypothetical protein